MLFSWTFIPKIGLNQAFMAKASCSWVYQGDFWIFLCVEQREAPPPHHPASCDVIKYALLQKPGVYPGPFKAWALSGSR